MLGFIQQRLSKAEANNVKNEKNQGLTAFVAPAPRMHPELQVPSCNLPGLAGALFDLRPSHILRFAGAVGIHLGQWRTGPPSPDRDCLIPGPRPAAVTIPSLTQAAVPLGSCQHLFLPSTSASVPEGG